MRKKTKLGSVKDQIYHFNLIQSQFNRREIIMKSEFDEDSPKEASNKQVEECRGNPFQSRESAAACMKLMGNTGKRNLSYQELQR